MTEIEKLKNGRRISKSEYAAAKALYEQTYANADEQTKAVLDGLMRSSLNYSAADPMNNRSAREFSTLIYKNAVAIANGTYNEAPAAEASTKNMFNGYSHTENYNNANALTNMYLSLGNPASGPSAQVTNFINGLGAGAYGSSAYPYSGYGAAGAAGTSRSTGKGTYTFRWDDGLGINGYENDFNAIKKKFAEGLSANLTAAKSAYSSGQAIRGLDTSHLNKVDVYKAQLSRILEDSNVNSAMLLILDLTSKLGIKTSEVENYFKDYMPKASSSATAKLGLERDGWSFTKTSTGNSDLDKLIKDKHWHIGELEEGNIQLFNSDYSKLTLDDDNVVYLNDDENSDRYGIGYVVTKDGHYWTGNFANPDSTYSGIVNNAITKILARNKSKYAISEDNLNQLSNIAQAVDSELLSKAKEVSPGKKIIDVSAYFGGRKVIAIYDDNHPENHIGTYGNLKLFDPNVKVTYIYKDAANNVLTWSMQDSTERPAELTATLNTTLNPIGLHEFSGISSEAFDDAADLDLGARISNRDGLLSLITNVRFAPIFDEKENGALILNNTKIKLAPFSYFCMALVALTSPEDSDVKKELNNVLSSLGITETPTYYIKDATRGIKAMRNLFSKPEDKKRLIKYILKYAEEHPEKLNETLSLKVLAIVDAYNNSVGTEEFKFGGVLKAASGASLEERYQAELKKAKKTSEVQNALSLRAAAAGVDTDVLGAREYSGTDASIIPVEGWTKYDSMRAAALLADITSTAAAISQAGTALGGTAVSEGAAWTAMGLDTAADFADPSVTAKQAWTNVAVNGAFALLAPVGGTMFKSARNFSKLAKLVTKGVVIANGLGLALDPEVRASVHKMTESGATADKMTTRDWQNIGYVLRALSGGFKMAGTRVGAEVRARKNALKISVTQEAKPTLVEKTTHVELSSKVEGGETVTTSKLINDATKAQIEETYKTDKEAAYKQLKEIFKDETLDEKDLDNLFTNGKLKTTTKPSDKVGNYTREKVALAVDKAKETGSTVSRWIFGPDLYAGWTDEMITEELREADKRWAKALSGEEGSWQKFLATLDRSKGWRGSHHSLEQVELMRAANRDKNGSNNWRYLLDDNIDFTKEDITDGTTAGARKAIYKRMDARAAAAGRKADMKLAADKMSAAQKAAAEKAAAEKTLTEPVETEKKTTSTTEPPTLLTTTEKTTTTTETPVEERVSTSEKTSEKKSGSTESPAEEKKPTLSEPKTSTSDTEVKQSEALKEAAKHLSGLKTKLQNIEKLLPTKDTNGLLKLLNSDEQTKLKKMIEGLKASKEALEAAKKTVVDKELLAKIEKGLQDIEKLRKSLYANKSYSSLGETLKNIEFLHGGKMIKYSHLR